MKIQKSDPIKTVLTISMGFLVLYFITKTNWPLIVSVSVGIAGLISDFLANLIDKIWFKLSYILSFIVPNILLTLVFFLFLLPIALLSKLFRNIDLLMLKNPGNTTFIDTNKSFSKESFEKPW